MALIECPECKGKVSDSAQNCPHCGFPINVSDEKQSGEINNVHQANDDEKIINKKKSVSIVVITVGIVIILMFMWITTSNRSHSNTSSHHGNTSTYTKSLSKYSDSEMDWYKQRNADLDITVTSVSSNSSYTICEGTIKNNGTTTYSYIKIKGSFMDKDGNVIDTDWTYGIGSEGLSAGESTTFRLSVDKNSNIKDCKITYVSD